MSLITIVTYNDTKLDLIVKQLQQLNQRVLSMSTTVDQIQADLAAAAANNAATLAALQEGLAELAGVPAQLTSAVEAQAALQAQVAQLQADLAAAGTPIPQSLIDAAAQAKLGSETILAAAQSIANIVPNPVV